MFVAESDNCPYRKQRFEPERYGQSRSIKLGYQEYHVYYNEEQLRRNMYAGL